MTIEALRASPLLASLPESTLIRLLDGSEPVALVEGEVLFSQGEEPDGLYVVVEGELEVLRRSGRDEFPLATSRRGDLIGELALARGGTRTATVRAATPARLLLLDAEAFIDLLTDRDSARSLLDLVTRRLAELELQLRQRDRLAVLGTLAAGLLHELNNPAAAVARGVEHLGAISMAWGELETRPADGALLDRLSGLLDHARPPASALERLRAETELGASLASLGVEAAEADLVALLAGLGIAASELEATLADVPRSEAVAALRWLALRGRVARLVEETTVGAARISEVVGAVKAYVHVGEAGPQDVEVHEGIEAAMTLLRGRVPSGVEVVRDYDPDVGLVPGNPADLNSVWMNLLDNALDAVGERGVITIRTRALDAAVRVEIENTGPVVPPEVLDRAFDPFFTTKEIGKGTGLGLATTHAVVSRHRGQVTLTSAEDRTVASVSLPRARR